MARRKLNGLFDSKEDKARVKYFAMWYLQDADVMHDYESVIDKALGSGSYEEMCHKSGYDPLDDILSPKQMYDVLEKHAPNTLKKFSERGEKLYKEQFGSDGWSEQLKKIREGKLSGLKTRKTMRKSKSKNKNTMNGIVPEGYKNVSKADIADEMSKQFPKVAKSTLKKMIDEYWVAITKILKSGKDSFIRINNVGSFKIVTKQYNKIVGKGKKKTTKKATTEKVKFEPSKNFESLVIKGKDLRKKRTGSTKTKTKAAAKNSGKSGSKNAAKTRTKKN